MWVLCAKNPRLVELLSESDEFSSVTSSTACTQRSFKIFPLVFSFYMAALEIMLKNEVYCVNFLPQQTLSIMSLMGWPYLKK